MKKFIFGFLIFVSTYVFAADKVIEAIDIKGNIRVEDSTILSYMDFVIGDKYNQEKIDFSLKKLYGTNLFSDISSIFNKGLLTIKLEENPLINKISFEGNKNIKSENLFAEIILSERSTYSSSKIQRDIRRIRNLYKKNGRFDIKISPKIKKLKQNRINIVFKIDEGRRAEISKVFFIGNKSFFANKLKSVIASKESKWYRILTSNDTYDPDRILYDRELLRKFYFSKGYADFKAISSIAEVGKDSDQFIVTFTIEEGQKYNFGKINVENKISDIDTNTLKEEILIDQGSTFNAELVQNTVQKLSNIISNDGYAFVKVSPRYKKSPKTKIIDVVFKVQEGPRVYIESIDIVGNIRTLDKVIRREFRISEGDPFNAAMLTRSEQRVRNLGFFDEVKVIKKEGSSRDKIKIVLQVKERSTGELNFGAGFSTTDGALANVNVRERNLLGKGQDLKLNLQRSSNGMQIDLGFTEPYFLGKDVSAGFDIFNITRDRISESSYESDTQGLTFRTAYSITEHLRHSIKYSLRTDDITDIHPNASLFIKKQEGKNTTSLIGHSLTLDYRDSKFEPTKGYYLKLNQDFAGIGGDSEFIRNEIRSGYYKSLYKNDVVLALSFRGGLIFGLNDNDVRINERFFSGGQDMRGFRNAGIGPRDKDTTDALGGNKYYVSSAEVSFPLSFIPDELGLKAILFTDVGNLYGSDDKGAGVDDDDSLRISSGIGVAWQSPMGPIRIDLGKALVKESYDQEQLFRINFGTRF